MLQAVRVPGESTTARKRILVIDDCPFFLEVIRGLLEEEFCVETVDSGDKAISLLETSDCNAPFPADPFDLVITDLQMPGKTGFDIAHYIKSRNKTNRFLPLLMLTEQEITKAEARSHGCTGYIPKNNLKKVVAMARILFTR